MGRMYLVTGYVASGKTTVANQLASATKAEVIHTDDVRKELFPLGFGYDKENPASPETIEQWIGSNDKNKIDFQQVLDPLTELSGTGYRQLFDKYAPLIKGQNDMVYETCFDRLDGHLSAGRDVVFDATFSKMELRDNAYRIARKHGIQKAYIVQVVCSEEAVKARLEARTKDTLGTLTSNAKQLEVFRIVKDRFDKSRMDLDNPESVKLRRLVYDTANQTRELIGERDEVTDMIETNVIDVLIKKFKR